MTSVYKAFPQRFHHFLLSDVAQVEVTHPILAEVNQDAEKLLARPPAAHSTTRQTCFQSTVLFAPQIPMVWGEENPHEAG